MNYLVRGYPFIEFDPVSFNFNCISPEESLNLAVKRLPLGWQGHLEVYFDESYSQWSLPCRFMYVDRSETI